MTDVPATRRVAHLTLVHSARQRSLQELWDAYVAAIQESQRTLKFEDGLKAATLYREFIEQAGRQW